jgi:hypothetical protein
MEGCYEYFRKAGVTRWQTLSHCLIAFCSFGLIEGIRMKYSQHIRQGVYFTHFSYVCESDDVRSVGILLHITVSLLLYIRYSVELIWLYDTQEHFLLD